MRRPPASRARPATSRAFSHGGVAPWRGRLARLACAVVVVALASGSFLDAGHARPRRHDRRQTQQALQRFERPGLVIGDFALAEDGVLDGDTIRVVGLRQSLRLLALDAEETPRRPAEREAMAREWAAYVAGRRGASPRPVKFPTPLGEDAKRFAQRFFTGVTTVRLERDHPREIRDYYDRYLAYVLVQRGDRWVNFAVEAVRAGMSPYFTKYGFSRRFHRELAAAEAEARAARRGIWDPTKRHYPDYEERKAWWDARARFLAAFEAEARGRDEYVLLTPFDATLRLEQRVGHRIVTIGAVNDVVLGDRGPTKVLLGRRRGSDLPLVFFDKDLFLSSGLADRIGEYVRVEGTLTRYRRRSGREELQIVIERLGQLSFAPAGGADAGPRRGE